MRKIVLMREYLWKKNNNILFKNADISLIISFAYKKNLLKFLRSNILSQNCLPYDLRKKNLFTLKSCESIVRIDQRFPIAYGIRTILHTNKRFVEHM